MCSLLFVNIVSCLITDWLNNVDRVDIIYNGFFKKKNIYSVWKVWFSLLFFSFLLIGKTHGLNKMRRSQKCCKRDLEYRNARDLPYRNARDLPYINARD